MGQAPLPPRGAVVLRRAPAVLSTFVLGSAMLWATACTGATGDTEADVIRPSGSGPVWSDVITISDRRYEPDDLLADADRELTIVNEDDEAHTLTTFDGTVDVEIGPGEQVQIMTPPEPGAFPYTCRFHPEMGGEIDVMGLPR
jgi:plastocyanin